MYNVVAFCFNATAEAIELNDRSSTASFMNRIISNNFMDVDMRYVVPCTTSGQKLGVQDHFCTYSVHIM